MLPALIGAVASLAGGLLSNKANEKANKQAEANALRQEQLQKEFAQSGIQWKVADAQKAGIHPLYALGANTVSYSPTTVGSTPNNFDFLGDAGQNVGRAIQAAQSNPARINALQLTAAQLQNEGLKLDNDLKRTQLVSAANLANQPGTGPGMPNLLTQSSMPGQGNSLQVDGPTIDVSKKISPTASSGKHIEVGANPELLLGKTRHGYAPQIPQSLSESFEQDNIGYWQWFMRNKLFADENAIRAMPTRPGFRKHFSPWSGEYYYAKYPTYRDKRFRNLKGYPR